MSGGIGMDVVCVVSAVTVRAVEMRLKNLAGWVIE